MTSPVDDDDFDSPSSPRASWRRRRSTPELLHLGAAVMIAIAAALVAAWLWSTFRTQQQLDPDSFSYDINGGDNLGSQVPWGERLDAFFSTLYQLGQVGILYGVGLLTQAAAELLEGRRPET